MFFFVSLRGREEDEEEEEGEEMENGLTKVSYFPSLTCFVYLTNYNNPMQKHKKNEKNKRGRERKKKMDR